jgi:hypothetical protein
LPKIWGNTPVAHRSAVAASLLLCACGPAREPDEVRAIVAHLAPCRSPGPLTIQLEALGDFPASALTAESAAGSAHGSILPFPAATRAVSARAEGSGSYLGFGEAAATGDLDFMLWPRTDACTLWDAGYPVEPAGVALGHLPEAETMLVAGSLTASSDAARAVTVDLRTGVASEVQDGMPAFRAFASITAFGTHAMLVAGGIDPTLGGDEPEHGPPSATAFVFDIHTRRFVANDPIALAQPRARHGAVVLDSGDTLLVGGSGPNGVPLATLESVSPVTRSARAAGLATLGRARSSPTVFRLDDGRIFVGGGRDESGIVPRLEWLTPDAQSIALLYDESHVALAPHYAFAPLLGGSVLGVGACKTAPCSEQDVLWFPADGSAPLDLPKLSFDPKLVRGYTLVEGTDGSPWLVAHVGDKPVWRRFDAWTGVFDEPDVVPSSAPDADLLGPVALGSGVLGWLERAGPAGRVLGFRYDVRSRWARDLIPFLLNGHEHIGPSRPAMGLAVTGVELGPEGLALQGPGAEARVSDATYADLRAEIIMSGGAPPVIVLGGTRIGGSDCPWPGASQTATGEVLTVTRSGSAAALRRGGQKRSCSLGSGRLTFGLGAESAATRIRSFSIERL